MGELAELEGSDFSINTKRQSIRRESGNRQQRICRKGEIYGLSVGQGSSATPSIDPRRTANGISDRKRGPKKGPHLTIRQLQHRLPNPIFEADVSFLGPNFVDRSTGSGKVPFRAVSSVG